MATINWWETASAGDCYNISSWNDFIDYSQHSACTDFTIHSECTDTGQAFRFTQIGVLSILYGGGDSGDDMLIQANDADTYPYFKLLGGEGLEVEVAANEEIVFKQGGEQFILFDRSGDDSKVYGGETTADDLLLYANSVDAYPYLELRGNSGLIVDVKSGAGFIMKMEGANIFSILKSGDDTTFYGGENANDDLFLKANSNDVRPYIQMNGNADLYIDVPDGQVVGFKEDDGLFMIFYEDATDDVIEGYTSNNDLFLKPAGSGVVKYGTYASITTEVLDGYITIKDAAGNTRKLATVA